MLDAFNSFKCERHFINISFQMAYNVNKETEEYQRSKAIKIPQPLYQNLQRIRKKLQQKKSVNLKDYCQVCKLALALDSQILYKELTIYQNQLNENAAIKKDKLNWKSFVGFLLKPDIIFYIVERVQIKKSQVMREAGEKVAAVIFQAWSYYLHLIKRRKEQDQKKHQDRTTKQVVLFDQQNQRMAKKRINYMLNQIQANKYRWQNYTKEGIVKIQQQKKEIEEELAFIKLLQTMLMSQITKIIRRRKEGNIESERKELEQGEESQEKHTFRLPYQKSQKKLMKFINIGKFYKQKSKLTASELRRDVIKESEEQRRCNIIALRYRSHRQIEQ